MEKAVVQRVGHWYSFKGFKYKGSFLGGLDNVLKNINAEIGNIQGRTVEGMYEAMEYVRNETLSKPPLTPMDTGNLRQSWFVVGGQNNVGFGARPKFKNVYAKKSPRLQQRAQRVKKGHTAALSEAKGMFKGSGIGDTFVIGGYSAYYAAYVHEDSKHIKRWTTSGSDVKWLQYHFAANQKKIFEIIAKNARVK